jgi:hypothetical protein
MFEQLSFPASWAATGKNGSEIASARTFVLHLQIVQHFFHLHAP